jgi:hypothetical protein
MVYLVANQASNSCQLGLIDVFKKTFRVDGSLVDTGNWVLVAIAGLKIIMVRGVVQGLYMPFSCLEK